MRPGDYAGGMSETDTTLTQSGKAADAKAVGDKFTEQSKAIADLEEKIPSEVGGMTAAQISALDGMFKIASFATDPTTAYSAFKAAFGIEDGGEVEPDEPDTPTVTLTSISATYSGGDVAVGTALSDLSGIVVTATYSDNSTATVADYTLSGEIAEGENVITVSYGGLTATFTVTGVAESEGENNGWVDGEAYTIEWTDGYGIDHSGSMGAGEAGAVYESSNLSVSNYLPCHGANRITVNNVYTGYGTFYYDEDKTYIDRYTQNNVSINEPVVYRNAYFVRFQKYKDKEASATPHLDPILPESTAWETGKHYRLGWIDGITINSTTGAVQTHETTATSEFAFCYGATELQCSTTARMSFFFYDSEKNFMELIIRQNKTDPITIPNGAKYFRTTGSINKVNVWVTLD